MTVKHPAKYPDGMIPFLARALTLFGRKRTLDLFGGIGKLAHVKRYGYTGQIAINEIEPEWADQALGNGADAVTIADARSLRYPDGTFDAICTSPVYGNKMSEHCTWKADRKCTTYKSYLGRDLNTRNAGRYYFWEREYADIHWPAWMEGVRLLEPGGFFIINTKNFIRLGVEQDVTGWHLEVLERLGLYVLERHQIETPGQRFGANADKRVSHEDVTILRKPGGAS